MSKKPEKEKNQHIHVYVRCRPQNVFERKANSQIVVETNQENREVIVKERLCEKEYNKKFTFDRVFGPENTQLDVYKTVASQCVEEVLLGYNCTVFAYGQTGTGKTYTMQGTRSRETNSWEEDPEAGIVPRALHHLFDALKLRFPEFTIRVSFLELYNEELFDLLSSMTEGNKLRLYDDVTRKGSVVIQGLSEMTVHTKEELYYIMELGTNRRKTASTLMNTDSSRSHTIFSITVHIRECTLEGEELLKTGKLNLVDLAGSECVGRSGAVDRRAREAGNINQSLLTLGRVITALVEKTPHIPYRESKLTRLLQDSLGGRTKTSIIATISPAYCSLEETLSTLDYAHRAKNITNKPEINQRMTKKMLIREYADEISKLRKELLASREKHGIYLDPENYNAMHEKLSSQKEEMEERQRQIGALTEEQERIKQLFSDSEKELNEKTEKAHECLQKVTQTSKVLEATSKVLSVATLQRDEQCHLVSRQSKTEKALSTQAQKLLSVVESSISDSDALHKKLLRKKHIEQLNQQQSESFQSCFQGRMAELFQLIRSTKSGQEKHLNPLSETFDSSMVTVKEESRELEEVFSALRSCHEQDISAQLDNIMQREEVLQEWTAQQLNQLAQHETAISQAEEEQLTQRNAPLYRDIEALLIKKDNLKDRIKDSVTTMFQEQLKTIEANQCNSLDIISRLQSDVHHLLENKKISIAKCQDTVENISARKENLFQNVSSFYERLDKFLELAKPAGEKLEDEERQICYDVAQVTSKLGDICEADATLPSMIESPLLQLVLKTDEMQTSCDSIVSRLQAETLDSYSQDKHLSERLCSSLVSLEDGVLSHSSDIQKDVENQLALATQAIEYIDDKSQRSFLEDQQEMDNLRQMVHATAVLHKQVVDKHLKRREEVCTQQKDETDHLTNAIGDLKENVDKFLHQQDQLLARFLHEELLRDVPTGQTPQRREYSYPRTLVATSPHEKILREFRASARVEAEEKLPLPEEDDNDKGSGNDTSFSSTVSDDGSVGSKDGSYRSTAKENWKKPKSRTHLPTPVKPLGVNNSNLINLE